ncbi:MAG: DNA translocase FtsK 4TM domain-containing protein [Pyrinomonadaceae bacterium]
MALTQTGVRNSKPPPPVLAGKKNSRRNEIVAIALFALAMLFALCLASYFPNDPSWNAGGESNIRNLVGSIGANVAAALLQSVGLAAYLVPFLLFAAAWRRFRTRRIHAPLSRVIGLVVLLLSASALLALSAIDPLFDGSVQPGGLAGKVIAHVLASGLNTVGASILLLAALAAGLLLATNFSFARAYEQITALLTGRLNFFHSIPEKLQAWRQKRFAAAEDRTMSRRAAQAEREQEIEGENSLRDKSPAERVAEFMRSTDAKDKSEQQKSPVTPINQATPIQRSAVRNAESEVANREELTEQVAHIEPLIRSLEVPLGSRPQQERAAAISKAAEPDAEIAAMVESVIRGPR